MACTHSLREPAALPAAWFCMKTHLGGEEVDRRTWSPQWRAARSQRRTRTCGETDFNSLCCCSSVPDDPLEAVQVHIPAVMVRGRLGRGSRESCCYLRAHWSQFSSAAEWSECRERDTLPNWFLPLWINLCIISPISSFNCSVLTLILKTRRNAFRWWIEMTPSQCWFTPNGNIISNDSREKREIFTSVGTDGETE